MKDLALLQERKQKLDALRADNKLGLDQLDAGNSTTLDLDAIKRRGRQQLASVPSEE